MGPPTQVLTQAQAVMAALLTPALFIVAAASFAASALARMGRVVDRVRKLAEAGARPSPIERERHRRRALLAERAVALYYGAAGVFVLAGLVMPIDLWLHDRIAWLPVGLAVVGMLVLVAGAVDMLRESRLAAVQIGDEIDRLASGGEIGG